MKPKVKLDIFNRTLLSFFFIILAILFIFVGALYFMNFGRLYREIEEYHTATFTQARRRMDAEYRNLLRVAQHITSNMGFLAHMDNNTSESDQEIALRLQAYIHNNPLVEEVLLYRRGSRDVFLSTGRHPFHVFTNELYPGVDWSGGRFFSTINSIGTAVNRSSFIAKPMRAGHGSTSYEDEKIVVMFPLPFLSANPEYTIVFIVRKTDVTSIFEHYLGELAGHIFIFDTLNSDPLYDAIFSYSIGMYGHTGGSLATALRQLDNLRGSEFRLDGVNYVVMRSASQVTGWDYVAAIPSSVFYSRVEALRLRAVIVIVLAGVALFAVIYLILKTSLMPLRSLVTLVRDTQPKANHKNEWDLIRHAFDISYKKNLELAEEMDAQKILVKDQFLIKLLKGRVKNHVELDYLSKCSRVFLEGEIFYPMLLSIEDVDIPYDEVEKAIIMIGQVIFNNANVLVVEMADNGCFAFIISFAVVPEDIKQKQLGYAQSINQLLESQFKWNPKIGIGNTTDDPLKLDVSFSGAYFAMRESLSNATVDICFFYEIESMPQYSTWLSEPGHAILLKSLSDGDKEAALSAFTRIMHNISTDANSYLLLRVVSSDIVNSIVKVMSKADIEYFRADINGLVDIASAMDFQKKMEVFIGKYSVHVSERNETTSYDLKSNIINYLNRDYKNSNLSLEYVSDKVGVSSTFLSRLIKNETGNTFNGYITKMRMEEMKKQLVNSKTAIKDIISDIGYVDSSSFVRKFKMLEGITPGQYRELYGNKE